MRSSLPTQGRCSVVIRALNEASHIGKLIHGLQAQTRPPDQIIVVDSGSTDGTVDIARSKGAECFMIDKSEFTFGRSLNMGLSQASGDVAVILSAHVYPLRVDFLQSLLAPFDEDKVGMTYGRQVGGPETAFSEHQIFRHWYPAEDIGPQAASFSNNACSAIRIDLWSERHFDEELPGLEDVEMARFLLNTGQSIKYCAEAVVVHEHTESWSAVRNRYRREAIAFKEIFPNDPFRFPSQFHALAMNLMNDMREAVESREGPLVLADILRFRLAQAIGIWEGHRGLTRRQRDQILRHLYFPRDVRNLESNNDDDLAIKYDQP